MTSWMESATRALVIGGLGTAVLCHAIEVGAQEPIEPRAAPVQPGTVQPPPGPTRGRPNLVRRLRRPAPIKQSLNNNAEQNKNAWLVPSVIEKNITIMAKPMWRDSAA